MDELMKKFMRSSKKDIWFQSPKIRAEALRAYTLRVMQNAWEAVHCKFPARAYMFVHWPIMRKSDIVRITMCPEVMPGDSRELTKIPILIDSIKVSSYDRLRKTCTISLGIENPKNKKKVTWYKLHKYPLDILDIFLHFWARTPANEGVSSYSLLELAPTKDN